MLGHTTATPTMLEAGVSRNVTPPVAKAVLDIRSTPDWTHDEMADVLRQALDSEVVVTSQRLVPCETPAGSRLLAVAPRACGPRSTPFGSPTCSDWVFLRHTDAIKCGPGHQPPLAHARRVRGPARGHRRRGLLRRGGAGRTCDERSA